MFRLKPDSIIFFLIFFATALPNILLAAPGDTIFSNDFENGEAWRPRPGIATSIVTAAGHGKVMRVSGRQEVGWNYAFSNTFTLEPGHKYRFTAKIKVNDISPLYPPYFKVSITKDGSGIQRAGSNSYNLFNGDNGWQDVFVEFESDAEADGGWIFIEKGTNNIVDINIEIDDVLLVEIADFSPHPYHFDTIPAPLAALSTVHPRIYLTAEKFALLKSKMQSEPYTTILNGMLIVADIAVADGPPPYTTTGGRGQTWQRTVGNRIVHLAMTYKLTGDEKYLTSAKEYMLASAGYPTWGLGSWDGIDLAASHQLFGLALGYDWLYHDLDAATLDTVRQCLLRRGEFMFQIALKKTVWWHELYLQNHLWVNMTGLSAAGFALFGEGADVDGWILLPLEKFKTTMLSLGPDGASHEGLPYWSYGLEYMLKFMEFARDFLAEDLYTDNSWFENTYLFRLYGMLPPAYASITSSLMTFADGPRYDWYGPDYLLYRLASEYNNPTAQWLAQTIFEADFHGPKAYFLNMLWFDPTVSTTPPDDLPTLKHFEDMDIVFMRSGWGDRESVSAFKCGPHIGHHAVELFTYDPGSDHVHPDEGAFQIFAHGDWLIVDDFYTRKTTAYQNTALINGIGQEGEGVAAFAGTALCEQSRGAKIVRVDAGEKYDYIIGNVTDAYKEEAGLNEFLRHVLYIKPDVWVIADEFSASSPSLYELYFHGDFPFTKIDDRTYTLHGDNGALRITSLTPDNVNLHTWMQTILHTDGHELDPMPALKISNQTNSAKTLFITVLEAYPANASSTVTGTIEERDGEKFLSLQLQNSHYTFKLDPERTDRNAPLFIEQPVASPQAPTLLRISTP